MARQFRRTRRGITLGLDGDERDLLVRLFEDVGQLVAPQGPDAADPLTAMMGITEDAVLPPDPALARLLPDATRDDPKAAEEFRRYTERGLRSRKRDAAAAVVTTLTRGRLVVLTDAEAATWLTALTDVRLVLAERLGLRTDEDADLLHLALQEGAPEDPRRWPGAVYDLLTWLQEGLADVMLASLPEQGERP